MNNDTVNETWIDTLVDELVDAKNKVSRLIISSDRLDTLVTIILNNAELNYQGNGLRISSDTPILEFLRSVYPTQYANKITTLKTEQEAELKKLADAKAKESKGKKEA